MENAPGDIAAKSQKKGNRIGCPFSQLIR